MKNDARTRHLLSWVPAIASIAILTLVACGPKDVVYLDMVAQAESARKPPSMVELNAVQLRDSSDHWWGVERPKGAPPFAWAGSRVVGMDLDLTGTVPLELSFRCWPFSWKGAPDQRLRITLNETVVADLKLRRKKSTYFVDLPMEAVYRGLNHLELRFDHVGRPVDHKDRSGDLRTLAAGFEYLKIVPKTLSVGPAGRVWRPELEDEGLMTTIAHPVVFTTRLGEGCYLDLQAQSSEGPLRADVWVRIGDRPGTVLASQQLNDDESVRWQLDLSEFANSTVEIGLGAGADNNGAPNASVRWMKATVLGPAAGLTEPNNVILIVVDTLRPDYLSAYGGPARSPNIDGLISAGAKFQSAYSHVPITGPSFSSLFTSLLPSKHGVQNNSQVLSDDFTTLAEVFKAAGYSTGGFVSLGVLDGRFGFAQGFDHFDDSFSNDWMKNAEEVNSMVLPWLETRGDAPLFLWVHYSDPHEPYTPPSLSYPAIRVLLGDTEVGRIKVDGRSTRIEMDLPTGSSTIRLVAVDPEAGVVYGFPFLGFADKGVSFQLGEGWSPTKKPNGSEAFDSKLPATLEVNIEGNDPLRTTLNLSCKERLRIRQIRDRYVAEIEYLDGVLGELLGALEAKGILEDSLVLFVADHGEGMGDHDHTGHITQVYDSLIRVPLSLTFPGHIQAGTVVEQRVGLVDLFPTILDAVGLPIPRGLDGRSLMPLIKGEPGEGDHPLVAMTFKPEAPSDKKAIILGGYKYIHSTADSEWEELYDLRTDPTENNNLQSAEADTLKRLRGELEAILSTAGVTQDGAEQAELSEEDRARLRELGYLR